MTSRAVLWENVTWVPIRELAHFRLIRIITHETSLYKSDISLWYAGRLPFRISSRNKIKVLYESS